MGVILDLQQLLGIGGIGACQGGCCLHPGGRLGKRQHQGGQQHGAAYAVIVWVETTIVPS
jgi:hypothetical protein